MTHHDRWALILGASSGFGIGSKIAHAADNFHLLDNDTGQAVKGFFDNPFMKAGAGGLGSVLGGIGMFESIGQIQNGKDEEAFKD